MSEVSIKHNNTEFATLSSSGSKTLLTAGTYVSENIQIDYTAPSLQTKSIDTNGTYTPDSGYDGISELVADIPQPEYSGYLFQYDPSTISNTGWNSRMKNSIVETWNMESTGAGDFYNSGWNSPKKIYFKNGIKHIGESLCLQCGRLEYVYLANTIEDFDESAPAFGSSVDTYDTLTTIEIEEGFNCNLNLSRCHHLTYNCLLNIITKFADNSGKTLTLSEEMFRLFSSEGLLRATTKGLTIANSGLEAN